MYSKSYDLSMFDYLRPTPKQRRDMSDVKSVFQNTINQLHHLLPPGKETDRIYRALWSAMMWANITITRNDDGTPRHDT